MHELGIAQNILQIVEQSVPEGHAADVRTIRIRVGRLSGVVPESLDFCFGAIVAQSGMPQAGLKIEQVPLTSRCRDCGHAFEIEDYEFSCPSCQSVHVELISGRELEVVEIELAENGD